jgi:cell division protein FtsL
MKKSSKPTIFIILTLLLILTAFALVSVGVKLKYEQYVLQKDKAEKIYKSENQRKIKLTAEFQTVTSEERIVAVAKSDLGMIRNIEAPLVIKYENQKIENLSETLKEKYE